MRRTQQRERYSIQSPFSKLGTDTEPGNVNEDEDKDEDENDGVRGIWEGGVYIMIPLSYTFSRD